MPSVHNGGLAPGGNADPLQMTGSKLPYWQLKSRTLLPIVQGGMGIGVSAHRLAGTVAHCGALGTVASVDPLPADEQLRFVLGDLTTHGWAPFAVVDDAEIQMAPVVPVERSGDRRWW